MDKKQLDQVIDRLNTRIPLTDCDDKFDRMIFFKHGEGVHISEYDAWIKIVMEAAEKFSEVLPLLEKIKANDFFEEDYKFVEEVIEIVFPEEEENDAT